MPIAIKKSDKMLLIEERTEKSIDEYLRDLYINKNLPYTEIQKVIKIETGVHLSIGSIYYWFILFSIKANRKRKLIKVK